MVTPSRMGIVLALLVLFPGSTCLGDRWDPTDDSPRGATELVKPEVAERIHGPHTVGTMGDPNDWFRIYLKAGFTHVFHTAGGTGDNYGELYSDPNGVRQVASNDDGGNNAQFRIAYSPPTSGWYWLKVRPLTAGRLCSYTLRYSRFRVGAVGAGNGGQLTVDGPALAGRLVQNGEVHSYQFVAGNRNPHVIETTLGTLRDSLLQLHSANGAMLTSDDDGGEGLASRIVFHCTPGITYTVRVRALGNADVGTYTVRVTNQGGAIGLRPPPGGGHRGIDPVHFNGGGIIGPVPPPGGGQLLTVNGPAGHGQVNAGGQGTWFQFVAGNRNPHVIRTALGTLGDSVLYLCDANRRNLASDDDGGGGLASMISWQCTPGATYRVRVRGFGGRTGTFTVRVTNQGGGGLPPGFRPGRGEPHLDPRRR